MPARGSSETGGEACIVEAHALHMVSLCESRLDQQQHRHRPVQHDVAGRVVVDRGAVRRRSRSRCWTRYRSSSIVGSTCSAASCACSERIGDHDRQRPRRCSGCDHTADVPASRPRSSACRRVPEPYRDRRNAAQPIRGKILAPVITASTPGIARAALASTRGIRACPTFCAHEHATGLARHIHIVGELYRALLAEARPRCVTRRDRCRSGRVCWS